MTRIYTEGFELGITSLWVEGSSGIWAASGTQKRTGSYGLQSGDGTGGYVYHSFSGISEAYFRVAHYRAVDLTSNLRIFAWNSGTTELGSIRWNSGKITLYTGTGTYIAQSTRTLSANTWYLFEVHVKIHDTVGVIEVKIDGGLEASLTLNGDTKPGSETTMSRIYLWGSNNYNYFDDLALNDTNGSEDNSWCGDGRIIRLAPNLDGDVSQLTPSSGSAHYALVDDLGGADYVSGSAIGKYDLYHITDTGFTEKAIRRVWVMSRALDTVAEGGYISNGLKTGGTEVWSASSVLLTSYSWTSGSIHTTNPVSGSPWTIADIDGLQIGVKVEDVE